MNNLLNDLDTIELLNKIDNFKKIDLKNTPIDIISQKSLETLSCMIVEECTFKENTRLYRIRKLNSDLSDIPKFFQDIWHPTAEMVKSDGRVNLKGQPMLYCSTEPVTPIYECGIKQNDLYALIQYSVSSNSNLIGYTVGNNIEPDGLNQTGKINNKIINDFLKSEFTKPVGKGTEYLYKISNVISKNFMDMPFCDAYVYPSIQNYKKGLNVAIKPESAINKIKFDCILICKSHDFDINNNFQFEILHKANTLKDDKLIYIFSLQA